MAILIPNPSRFFTQELLSPNFAAFLNAANIFLLLLGLHSFLYRLHFIHIQLAECYYIFNLISSNGVVYLDRLSGAWYSIPRQAKGCLSYTHILSRYNRSDIHGSNHFLKFFFDFLLYLRFEKPYFFIVHMSINKMKKFEK